MTENPNYYAIIPAKIRYDKELCLGARMLYGEITALCNKEGYCWASNRYFANLYGVTIGTASTWIGALVRKGYMTSEVVYKNGQVLGRHIKIAPNDFSVGGIRKNQDTPKEKSKHNNINNNINNNKNDTKVSLTQSVDNENPIKDTLAKSIKKEEKEMLFNLEPIKKTSEYLPYNHTSVKRYLKKIEGKELMPVENFSATDWLLSFVVEYNKQFTHKYPLPHLGPTFNGLVRDFSRLLEGLPIYNREIVFSRFIEIVKKGNRLPKSWQNGFVLEQLVSGYNSAAVTSEFQRLNEILELGIGISAPNIGIGSSPKKGMPAAPPEYF